MSAYIINAAPMEYSLGTEDLSKVQLPRVPENIPQHLAKFYIWAEKGPLGEQLVSGAELINMFGSKTFDERGKFFNHSTKFATGMNSQGAAVMLERVVPDDAGPAANIILWLDILPCVITDYARNSDGSIKHDNAGNPIISGNIQGFKVKWVTSYRATAADQALFGQAEIKAGTQVDVTSGTQSQLVPMYEFQVSSQGFWGTNAGFRLWAPTSANTLAMPTAMMANERAYPFYFASISRADINSSPKVKPTVLGDQTRMITFKPGVVDPVTDLELYMGDVLLDSYQNLTDPVYPMFYGDFGSLAIYEDNIAKVLKDFHAAEIPFIDNFSDFSSSPDDLYLFNFVSGVSSQNVPYHSFQFVDDVDSVILSEYSNIYAQGGKDGTMTDAAFATKVSERVLDYIDPNSSVQETAINVESVMYDTGFPLQTKYDLCSFIGLRKDTNVVLSTYQVGGPTMSAAEEHSVAIALRTRLQMFPESDYFGTPVMRGMIVGRSAKVKNSVYKKRLPLSYEVAMKAAAYMGASDGRWKNGSNFDGAPGSIVDYMEDISIKWVPALVRNKDWDVGLNWVQAYDRRAFFFPALKTVYDDDTSILNSWFVALAIGQLNKISQAAWREYSGVEGLTNAQLAKKVNDYVTKRVTGIFDGRYIIVPNATFTDMDLKRGFSWTLPIKIYGPNLKTVMTTYVQAYRIDDYKSA